MHICDCCSRRMEIVDHPNMDIIDVYSCTNCSIENHNISTRKIAFKGYQDILAKSIRIDDYHIIMNYQFNYLTNRSNYTIICKLDSKSEYHKYTHLINPMMWGFENVVCDLDFILDLPLHDISATKNKLKIYSIFN